MTSTTDIPADQPVFIERPPSDALTGLVERIVGYEERGARLDGAVEVASFVVPLVIGFGEDFRIGLDCPADETMGSFTSGLFAGPVVISSTGRASCVQVDLTPMGARRFFRMPMQHLAGRLVTLSDLGDPEMLRLRARLGETLSWARRLDLVETFLAARLASTDAPLDELGWAYGAIRASAGKVRIEQLATRIGWSRKHFSRRFTESFGLGPKTVARMARFHSALGMTGPDADLADIAFACGYSDQSHLTRDFAEFAGAPPARWLAQAA